MPLVIDASVTASWYFDDERHPVATFTLELIRRDAAIVPAHWWFEIRNVLLIGERRGHAFVPQTTEFIAWLRDLPITLAPLPDGDHVLSVARTHRLTFYDAAYLELALRMSTPIATLDTALAMAARSVGVPLVGVT